MKQQQVSEQEKLQRLRENVEKQEARLKKVRALKGQVEQKRVSNGKLGEQSALASPVCCRAFISFNVSYFHRVYCRRLSWGVVKPVCLFAAEEIEQMNSLFQQKQRELVVAVSKVEELSRQLEMLKNGKLDALHDNQSAVAELDRLYRELQVWSLNTSRTNTNFPLLSLAASSCWSLLGILR